MKNLFLFILTLTLFVSCSSDDSDNTYIDDDPETENNAIQLLNDATFGNILANSEGFTLYFFASDNGGDATCTEGCLTNWPIFFEEDLTLDSGLEASDFASITRTDGAKQTTYKGWPLYLFANDASAGAINGDGSGDVWFVAKPDYTIMVAKAQLIGRDSNGAETNLTSEFIPGDEDTIYITDAEGNTLYGFVNDTFDVNNFTASDFSNNGVWPIYETTLDNIPSILSALDFNVIDVHGRDQLTYKGWPLYYFGQDAGRGDNYGVGFPSAGIWPVLNQNSDPAQEEATSSAKAYTVGNSGASAYLFTGEGLSDASNPNITLKRGETYEFTISTPGHPFFIKTTETTGTGSTFNDGVTNNGASDNTITFVVPNTAPDTLFYICEFHGSMTGTLNIVD